MDVLILILPYSIGVVTGMVITLTGYMLFEIRVRAHQLNLQSSPSIVFSGQGVQLGNSL